MTWVVGLAGLEYGVLIGHTRVSFGGQPEHRFGVQKVHEVAANLAVGFSGSIEIGFWAVEDFRHFVRDAEQLPEPLDVMEGWARQIAARYGRAFGESTRRLGLSLMFVGLSPSIPQVNGHPMFAVGHIAVLRFPRPGRTEVRQEVGERFTALGIGSGQEVESYRSALMNLPRVVIDRLIGMVPRTQQSPLAAMLLDRYVAEAVKQQQVDGVSDHLVGLSVSLGGCSLSSNVTPPSADGVRTQGAAFVAEVDPDRGGRTTSGAFATSVVPLAENWTQFLGHSRRYRPEAAPGMATG